MWRFKTRGFWSSIGLLGLISLLGCQTHAQRGETTTLESPDGIYLIRIVTKDESKGSNLTHDITVADILKNNKLVVEKLHVYTGNQHDVPFDVKFSQREWLSKSLITLGPRNDQGPLDEVVAINRSSRPIPFLEIHAGNRIFFLFDLEVGGLAKLHANVSQFSGMVYTRKLQDGKNELASDGVNFSWSPDNQQITRYCVLIENAGVAILSSQLDGVRIDNSRVERSSLCQG